MKDLLAGSTIRGLANSVDLVTPTGPRAIAANYRGVPCNSDARGIEQARLLTHCRRVSGAHSLSNSHIAVDIHALARELCATTCSRFALCDGFHPSVSHIKILAFFVNLGTTHVADDRRGIYPATEAANSLG